MKRLLRLLLWGGLLAVAGAAVVAAWAWSTLSRPYQGFSGEEKRIVVAAGSSASTILRQLASEGVLADARLARFHLVYQLGDPPLQAGEYLFRGPATAAEVLAKLIAGEVVLRPVTVIEGLTLEETAAALVAAGFGQEPALLAAMRSPEKIADLDPEARDLEGYLFPDTYSFAANASAGEIVSAMVANFRRRFDAEVAPKVPAIGGWTPRRLVTLASIVEKETQRGDERPLVAAVYRNRLEQGIGLYADPTVIFALKRLGRWNGNLTRTDLGLESPYNTYRFGGLPPGPIASPGLAALLAAAQPATVDYLYFVSKNDGSHVFARTLAEHNRNVEEWQKRYWRRKWANEGAKAR